MPPKKEKVEWVVPPIPPPIEGPPRKYEFFDYEEGDDCATILEKNFLLKAMIGRIKLTYTPETLPEDADEDMKAGAELASKAGIRLASSAEMDYILKKALVDSAREKQDKNWVDTGSEAYRKEGERLSAKLTTLNPSPQPKTPEHSPAKIRRLGPHGNRRRTLDGKNDSGATTSASSSTKLGTNKPTHSRTPVQESRPQTPSTSPESTQALTPTGSSRTLRLRSPDSPSKPGTSGLPSCTSTLPSSRRISSDRFKSGSPEKDAKGQKAKKQVTTSKESSRRSTLDKDSEVGTSSGPVNPKAKKTSSRRTSQVPSSDEDEA